MIVDGLLLIFAAIAFHAVARCLSGSRRVLVYLEKNRKVTMLLMRRRKWMNAERWGKVSLYSSTRDERMWLCRSVCGSALNFLKSWNPPDCTCILYEYILFLLADWIRGTVHDVGAVQNKPILSFPHNTWQRDPEDLSAETYRTTVFTELWSGLMFQYAPFKPNYAIASIVTWF